MNGQVKPSVFHLLGQYGIRTLLNSDPKYTESTLGIVQGGRIKHEITAKCDWTDSVVVSMDLISCYGKALKHLFLPIGHPVKIFFPIHLLYCV